MVFCFGNHFLFKSILVGCVRLYDFYYNLPLLIIIKQAKNRKVLLITGKFCPAEKGNKILSLFKYHIYLAHTEEQKKCNYREKLGATDILVLWISVYLCVYSEKMAYIDYCHYLKS